MEELIKINEDEKGEVTVNGRDLHKFLEVKTKYIDWINRMIEYGFIKNIDFTEFNELSQKKEGSRIVERDIKNHNLNISMAKEIAMLQKNEKGKQIRLYFIEIDKRYNDPMYQLAKSLKYANRLIESKNKEIQNLTFENEQKQKTIEEQKPKVNFYDTVTESEDVFDFKKVAKIINVKGLGRNNLIALLREQKILDYSNTPYQKYVNLGYFKVVEREYNDYFGNSRVSTKTVVFQKGIDFILRLLKRLGYLGDDK